MMKYILILLIAMLEFDVTIAGGRDNGLRCPPVSFPNGKVRTRGRGKIIRYQCFEGFTLIGNKYSTCVRGRWDTQTPVCVNSQCRNLPTPEHALVAPKYDGAILIYFCAPGYILVGSAEIYCNGKQWNGTAPYCRDTTATAPLKCDFEKPDLCWWEQDPKHDFDWRRHNFETPSSHIGTGPTHDHTLGSGNDGYYLYIEASGRLVNDTARIISPLYNASLTNSGCFSFWYHMYGATIGTLRVYFKSQGSTADDSQVMFQKSGNQGNRWLHGFFHLPKANDSFQITIEGIRGSGYVSDIAIDDVAILQGDECLQFSVNQTVGDDIGTTDSITINQDDQIEIVNQLQSCRGRCDNDKSLDTLTTVIPLSSADACHCDINCAENSTCCPDFAEYCVLDVTDSPLIPSSSERIVNNTTLSEPKDELEPYTNTIPREPITHASVEEITHSVPRQAFSANTAHLVVTTESHISKKYIQQLDNGVAIGLSEVVSIVSAFVVLAIVIIAVIIFMTKRNKSYKRGSNKSSKGCGLAEDSDVRFLTSDEILDFNLARPIESEEA